MPTGWQDRADKSAERMPRTPRCTSLQYVRRLHALLNERDTVILGTQRTNPLDYDEMQTATLPNRRSRIVPRTDDSELSPPASSRGLSSAPAPPTGTGWA